ncbi:MAG: phosphotransferase [Anaerolineae bacterium]|nr:phosphotransferase [Anaerolineae bacterium]
MSNNRLRVLVVEDEPRQRIATVENLRQFDYEVHVAEGEGAALLADARRQLMEHFCHVAVINARLIGPVNLLDPTQFDLGHQFMPAGVVLYSTDRDDTIAYIAGWHRMGYVRASDPPRTLAEAVRLQADQRQVRINWPHDNFNRDIAQALRMKPEQLLAQDLTDLLGRLFPKAVAVELKLLPGVDGTPENPAATPVRRAVVLWTQERRRYTNYLTPKVTKISTRDRIQREVDNYTNHVESQLKHNRQARLEGHTLLWHIGACAYEFLGVAPDDLQPFQSFYAGNDAETILEALRTLFLQLCEVWYITERQVVSGGSLYALYDSALDLEEHLGRVQQNEYRLRFPGVNGDLPNPALWVLREGKHQVFDSLTTCIAHGDLHGDNFFVDNTRMTWLIDFEHTGRTHALRDFVELEADIKLRLTAYPDGDLSGLAALERSLLTARSVGDLLLPTPDVAADMALFKTFQTLAGLRHLACQATGITDITEYLHALLYETLFMATLRHLREHVRQRALLAAALIVDRLTTRSSLRDRFQTAVPRLDAATLDGRPPAEALAVVRQHLQHLTLCYRCAELQKKLYHGPALPEALRDGVELLHEEGRRTRALQETLQRGGA